MTFEEEKKILVEECIIRRENILRKYQDVPHAEGLDGDPANKELKEHSDWVDKEIKKLRGKYFN